MTLSNYPMILTLVKIRKCQKIYLSDTALISPKEKGNLHTLIASPVLNFLLI